MKKFNPHVIGVVTAVLFGLWHTAWSILVLVGLAGVILDWIYSLHFLSNPFQVQPFNMMTAVTLVIVTSIVGYVLGFVSTIIWNAVAKK